MTENTVGKSTILRGPDNPCMSLEECIRVNCPDCAHPIYRFRDLSKIGLSEVIASEQVKP